MPVDFVQLRNILFGVDITKYCKIHACSRQHCFKLTAQREAQFLLSLCFQLFCVEDASAR